MVIKADKVDLSGKFASQITTSKHFYDVTAHRYVEENCSDLGMKVVKGLSADMDDLLMEKGQRDARNFFDQLLFSCEHGLFVIPSGRAPKREKSIYQPVLSSVSKNTDKDVVIVTNYAQNDENLQNMISDLRAVLPYESTIVNLRNFKCFDDRQFCNGHRTVTQGTPIVYLISRG